MNIAFELNRHPTTCVQSNITQVLISHSRLGQAWNARARGNYRVCEFAGVERVDWTTGVDYWSGLLEPVAADYAHLMLVDTAAVYNLSCKTIIMNSAKQTIIGPVLSIRACSKLKQPPGE